MFTVQQRYLTKISCHGMKLPLVLFITSPGFFRGMRLFHVLVTLLPDFLCHGLKLHWFWLTISLDFLCLGVSFILFVLRTSPGFLRCGVKHSLVLAGLFLDLLSSGPRSPFCQGSLSLSTGLTSQVLGPSCGWVPFTCSLNASILSTLLCV